MPAILEPSAYAALPVPAFSQPVAPLLRETPVLLDYRADADPDVEFIPKTVGGFCLGAMVFGFCLNFAEALFTQIAHSSTDIINMMTIRFAFMLGITGVAASLLLVGLKVRADHSDVELYPRHWLNSIGTGAFYALMIWGPWILMENGWAFSINRFLAAAVWMALMTYPAFAAKWTIGPMHGRCKS